MNQPPHFLIIGAMRAGTTTLFQDLERHPQLFLPEYKEPEFLCDDGILDGREAKRYARLFAEAKPGQLRAEASTAYTKLPDRTGVPARARAVCGPDLKLIYIVREPISRARSAHHHEISKREVALPIDAAMREAPRFLNYSRYAMQLEAWLEVFAKEQFFVLRFEDYVAAREDWARRVCTFLGVDPLALPTPSDDVFNKTANRPTSTPFWRRYVHTSPWYEQYVKPRLPRGLRHRAAELLLPKAPPAPERFAPETMNWMVETLRPDTERFETLFRTHWPETYTSANGYDLDARYSFSAA